MPLTKLQGQLIDSTTNLTTNNITVSGTFVPPTGNTASRPSNPVVGTTWFNSTLNTLESWSGSIWQSAGGGLILQTVQNTSFTAAAGYSYPVNTSNGAITVTLPASPTAGQQINIFDYASTFSSNNITISPNGGKINGVSASALVNTTRASITLVYVDSIQGWVNISVGNATYIPTQYSVSYLVVAGGGGGAGAGNSGGGGGGGAGGLLSGTSILTTGTNYTVIVGAGGAYTGINTSATASNGNNSAFGISITSIGGGGGAYNVNGASGGSGGGAGYTYSGGSGTSGQGFAGGGIVGGTGGNRGGCGGGGASAAGSNLAGNSYAQPSSGSAGGSGITSSITGSSVTYAGGGGGGSVDSGSGGSGGSGGGGAGGDGTPTAGTGGTTNLGGGGGGGGTQASQNNPRSGASGGSGVVILSVPTANYSNNITGSPTVTTSGSNTILKFTSSGSYTA